MVDDAASIIGAETRSVLAETLGHYPAPLAILDCVGEDCRGHLIGDPHRDADILKADPAARAAAT